MKTIYTEKAQKSIARQEKNQVREERNLYVDQAMAGLKSRYENWVVIEQALHKSGATPDVQVVEENATGVRLTVKEVVTGVTGSTFVPKKGLTMDWFKKQLTGDDTSEWIGQTFRGKVISYMPSDKFQVALTFDINKSQFEQK